jgi:hypothetical protein
MSAMSMPKRQLRVWHMHIQQRGEDSSSTLNGQFNSSLPHDVRSVWVLRTGIADASMANVEHLADAVVPRGAFLPANLSGLARMTFQRLLALTPPVRPWVQDSGRTTIA